MIVDKLDNFELYSGIGQRIYKALQFLRQKDFGDMKDGRCEIDGENIFASVMRYQTKPEGKGKWESHKKYIDVQFIAGGKERIGYSNISNMIVKENYSTEKDVQFLEGEGNFLTAGKNTFVILFPQDAHMPGISPENEQPAEVLKVVVKVKAE